jgi:uncharacterized lipoprotein YddW (UPF0748 family)
MRIYTFIYASILYMLLGVAPSRAEFRGVWIYDPRELDAENTMVQLQKRGFNNVFVRLSSGGAAYYPSKVMPTAPESGNQAKRWSDAAHKHGIKIHAWHVCFMMHNAPAASMNKVIARGEAMMDFKGRIIRPSYGAVVRAPAADSTLEFERAAMVELATKFNLDGVQFDYIRYPIYSVDYSPAARKRFKEDTGKAIKNWPSDVRKGKLAPVYKHWKENVVTGLVRDVSRSIRSANSEVKISAAVWNDPDVGCDEFGQDWPKWVEAGYLDFVCPMSYTTSEAALRRMTRKQKKMVAGKVPIYSGLGCYMMSKSSQLNRQIGIVRDEDIPGYVLYNYNKRTLNIFFPSINN